MKTSAFLILIIQLLIISNKVNCQDTLPMMIDSALYYEIPEQYRVKRERVIFTPDSIKKKHREMHPPGYFDEINKKPDTTSSVTPLNKSVLGTISAHGRLTYLGADGSIKIGKRVKVEIYEKDGISDTDFSSDYKINNDYDIYTDDNGEWSLTGINNTDPAGFFGRDLYVKYKLENIFGGVNDYSDNLPYTWNTWVLLPHDDYEDITDGTNVTFDLNVTDNNKPSLWLYQIIQNTYYDSKFTGYSIGDVTFHWQAGLNPIVGNYAKNIDEKIYVNDNLFYTSFGFNEAIWSQVILHELGHFYMYSAYGNYIPDPNCVAHSIPVNTSENCAWVEGWGIFFCLAMRNSSNYQQIGGENWNFEAPNITASGDQVEGRVAAALWDLYDTPNDGCDQYGFGFDEIWNIIYNVNNSTFLEFWNSWTASKHFAVSSIQQNTIDYNTAPVLNSIPNQSLDINTNLTLNLTASDDESSLSELEFLILSNSDPNCVLSINGSQLSINPVSGWSGSSTVSLKASDICKNSNTQNFTITVNPLPILSVNPQNFDVSASSVQSQVSVTNSGSGSLNWTVEITQGSNWLTDVNPLSGTNDGNFNINYSENNTGNVRTGQVKVNSNGTGNSFQIIQITQQSYSIDFSASSTSIFEGNTVTFTDLSQGTPTSWEWTFEAGTPASSSLQNPPPIKYNTAGTYDVTLNTLTKTGYITVNAPAPVPNFTYSSPTNFGTSITFNDITTGTVTSRSWNFGDGSTSSLQNPTHTYYSSSISEIYKVSLTTTNSSGSNTIEKDITVTHSDLTITGRVISDSYVGLSGISISTNVGSPTVTGYNGNFTINVPYNTSFTLSVNGGSQFTSWNASYTYSQNTNIGDIMLYPITLFIQKTTVSATYYKFSAEHAPIGTTDYKWYLNGNLKQNSTSRFYYYYSECNTTFTIGLQVTGSGTYDAANISVSVPTCPNVTSGVTYNVNNQCSTVRVGQEVTITDISYPFDDIDKLNVWWSDGSGENWCLSSSCASTPENSVYAANCKEFTHTFNSPGHYAATLTASADGNLNTNTASIGFNVVDCTTQVTQPKLSGATKDNWNSVYSFWAGKYELSGFNPKYTYNYVYPANDINVGACTEIVLNPGVTIAPNAGKQVVFYIDECLQTNPSKKPQLIDTYTSFEDYCVAEMLQQAIEVNKKSELNKNEASNSEYKILIFPNPNNGKFFIDITNNDYTITKMEIYNSLGQSIMEKLDVNKNRYNVDISTQPYGFYYLKVYSEDKIETFKIIYTTNQ